MQITTNHLLLLKPDQKIWNISSFASILLKLGIIMFWLTLSKMSLDTRYPKNTKWDILKKTTDIMDIRMAARCIFLEICQTNVKIPQVCSKCGLTSLGDKVLQSTGISKCDTPLPFEK